MMRQLRYLTLLLSLLSPSLAAHELLSVVLRLDESPAGQVSVVMKTPLSRDGRPVTVVPQFLSGDCQAAGVTRSEREGDVILRQWRMACAGGLAGQPLRIDGLDPQVPDAVVTARFADGRQMTRTVDRHDSLLSLESDAGLGPAPGLIAYVTIGIEHILLGPDHLLFVLGLMLVVAARRDRSPLPTLLLTITAFTVAHSLTLALAVLGIWGLPPKAVELLIALSIVLLALELATHDARARRGLPPSLTLRRPWLVAFGFGLLHGFGFAGALAGIGLPEQARGWALFLFNVGVETGQLIFVTAVLLIWTLLRRIRHRPFPAQSQAAVVTLLGGVAMYWTLDRLWLWSVALWAGV
jgi:hypothetical protein